MLAGGRARFAGISLAVVLIATASVALPVQARADTLVTISGTVSRELPGGGSAPLVAGTVSLFPLTGSGTVLFAATTTASGTWSISSVPTGTYRVYFAPAQSATEPLAAEWWGDQYYEASGDILTVVSSNVTGINAMLDPGSTISGTITTNGSGALAAAAAFLWDPFTRQFARFSSRAVSNSSGVYTIYGVPPGDYLLRFGDVYDAALSATEYWDDEDYIRASHPVSVADGVNLSGYNGSLVTGGVGIERISGSSRYETSVAISQAGFDPSSTSTVFVVNGLTFPDALSSGPAAALVGAPVLLVSASEIPAVVATELDRLDPDTIVIVGGTPSVSSAVETSLSLYAAVVLRIQGADRFETSRNVAQTYFADGDNRTAYLATGLDFPDALAAGPAAANEFGPLILVNGTATTLDAANQGLIQDLGFERLVITGGTPSVSSGIESSARAIPSITEVYRRAGTSRYDTGVKVNRASFAVADTVFLTTGLNFPDALAGAALAGSAGLRSPIYQVPTDCVPVDVLNEINRLHPKEIILLGGLPSLSQNVFNLVPCP